MFSRSGKAGGSGVANCKAHTRQAECIYWDGSSAMYTALSTDRGASYARALGPGRLGMSSAASPASFDVRDPPLLGIRTDGGMSALRDPLARERQLLGRQRPLRHARACRPAACKQATPTCCLPEPRQKLPLQLTPVADPGRPS